MQLCNSNPKIHFQDRYINLVFECVNSGVKIVEIDFNSQEFLIIYQEIRFLNQVTCFLNQEERRQFLISFVCQRD